MRTPFLLTPFEPQTFSGKDAKPCFVFSYGVSVKGALLTFVNSAVPVNTDEHAVWKVFFLLSFKKTTTNNKQRHLSDYRSLTAGVSCFSNQGGRRERRGQGAAQGWRYQLVQGAKCLEHVGKEAAFALSSLGLTSNLFFCIFSLLLLFNL